MSTPKKAAVRTCSATEHDRYQFKLVQDFLLDSRGPASKEILINVLDITYAVDNFKICLHGSNRETFHHALSFSTIFKLMI